MILPQFDDHTIFLKRVGKKQPPPIREEKKHPQHDFLKVKILETHFEDCLLGCPVGSERING